MKRILLVLFLFGLTTLAGAQQQVRILGGAGVPATPSGGGSDDYAFYCSGGGYAGSGTPRVTDGSETDVEAKYAASSDGDIICVPPGTFTWVGAGTGLSMGDKDVMIIGAGLAGGGAGGTTIVRNDQYTFYADLGATDGNFRITGFRFEGNSSSQGVIAVRSGSYAGVPSGRWRVDHNHFYYTSGGRSAVYMDSGVNYGVIDHNQATWSQGVVYNHRAYLSGTDDTVFGEFINRIASNLSTDQHVFIEDNTFASGAGLYVNVYDGDGGGGRVVYRYNICTTGCFFYNHWTGESAMSSQVMQVYSNTFKCDANYDQHIARIEAGTGIFANNSVNQSACTNAAGMVWLDDRRPTASVSHDGSAVLLSCNGTRAWDGNAGDTSAPGWPCFGQIGRGPGKSWATITGGDKQISEPFYIWNNGTADTCRTGGACTDITTFVIDPTAYIKATPHTVTGGGYGQGEVDYVHGAKPGYTPPTYPHAKVAAWP